jgi:hypothetical protein
MQDTADDERITGPAGIERGGDAPFAAAPKQRPHEIGLGQRFGPGHGNAAAGNLHIAGELVDPVDQRIDAAQFAAGNALAFRIDAVRTAQRTALEIDDEPHPRSDSGTKRGDGMNPSDHAFWSARRRCVQQAGRIGHGMPPPSRT